MCGRDWSSDVCSSDLLPHNIMSCSTVLYIMGEMYENIEYSFTHVASLMDITDQRPALFEPVQLAYTQVYTVQVHIPSMSWMSISSTPPPTFRSVTRPVFFTDVELVANLCVCCELTGAGWAEPGSNFRFFLAWLE